MIPIEALIGIISALSAVLVVLVNRVFDLVIMKKNGKTKDTIEILAAIKDLRDEQDQIRTDIFNLSEEEKKNETVQCRVRILRFADELMHGVTLHSKDHFDQTMDDITTYETYCETHPQFKNDITKASIKLIRDNFDERLRKNDFL